MRLTNKAAVVLSNYLKSSYVCITCSFVKGIKNTVTIVQMVGLLSWVQLTNNSWQELHTTHAIIHHMHQ